MIAYLDLVSGASGDMLLACLAAAGRDLDVDVEGHISEAVAGLDCTVTFEQVTRGGIAATRAVVSGGERHLGVPGLRKAVADSRAATAAFEALVGAEARVHGVSPDDVDLHELGTADTAVDLLGMAVSFEALDIDRLAASAVPIPRGWIGSAHGPLPVPAPATLELLRGALLEGVDETAELVTPTAAAVLASSQVSYGPLPPMTLDAVGVGAGTRELDRPNICRLLVGSEVSSPAPELHLETDVLLETNIDDATPETIAHAIDALLEAGAVDVWITPITMKKSRPAFQLSVLVPPSLEDAVLRTLFRETTTLGTRRRETPKWVLGREVITVDGIRVKIARLDGEVVTVSPEFSDCAEAAARSGKTLREVYTEALEEARRRTRAAS